MAVVLRPNWVYSIGPRTFDPIFLMFLFNVFIIVIIADETFDSFGSFEENIIQLLAYLKYKKD